MIGIGLAPDRHRVGNGLGWIGTGLASDCDGLEPDWRRNGKRLEWIGAGLARLALDCDVLIVDWCWIGVGLT